MSDNALEKWKRACAEAARFDSLRQLALRAAIDALTGSEEFTVGEAAEVTADRVERIIQNGAIEAGKE